MGRDAAWFLHQWPANQWFQYLNQIWLFEWKSSMTCIWRRMLISMCYYMVCTGLIRTAAQCEELTPPWVEMGPRCLPIGPQWCQPLRPRGSSSLLYCDGGKITKLFFSFTRRSWSDVSEIVSESVSDSENRVDWCDPGEWRYLLRTLLTRLW